MGIFIHLYEENARFYIRDDHINDGVRVVSVNQLHLEAYI